MCIEKYLQQLTIKSLYSRWYDVEKKQRIKNKKLSRHIEGVWRKK